MIHHEANMIEDMEDSEMDPIVYIGSLLGATVDGKLTWIHYPDDGSEEFPVTYCVDWTFEDACYVAERLKNLLFHLRDIASVHDALRDREQNAKILAPEQLAVWETYIAPFEEHGFDEEEIVRLQMKEEIEELTEEESALLEESRNWYGKQCLKRLPYNRCSPAGMIYRANCYYEMLVDPDTPEFVTELEACRLAEQMVLYYCKAEHTHTCRCCGNTYVPEELIVDGSVCPVCDWQEDGTAETDYSYFNGASLQDYRKEYYAEISATNDNS